MDNHFNYTIIGAGIIGLAIAERLSNSYSNILVLEKEKGFGLHTSSRNSEVIHSGYCYPSESLKAKLCVKGNRMIYDFCDKYKIAYNKCGKLIVAHSDIEIDMLRDISLLAKNNGVSNTKILSEKEALSIEPNVKCRKSLWIPSTGIMDSHLIMSKLENLSLANGVSFTYNLNLKSIEKDNNGYLIDFENDDIKITSDYVINCGGLWAHNIANKLLNYQYKVEYYKGDYFKTTQMKNLNCLIYPIPKKLSLGIHALINLNGEVLFGPNAYKVNKIDYHIDDTYKTLFIEEANKLTTNKITEIYCDYSGIRPKIKYDGKFNDFMIKEESSLKNFYNLVGIDSPGLTSSLAIAEYIHSLISKN